MEKFLETNLEQVSRWDSLEHAVDNFGDESSSSKFSNNRPEQQLHRDYIKLFGMHPKMEDRIYSRCEICEQVFNPHTVSNHKEFCAGKVRIQIPHLKKKVKSKKKLQNSSVPLPPLFKKETTDPPLHQRYSETVSAPPPPSISTPASPKLSTDLNSPFNDRNGSNSRPITPKIPSEVLDIANSTPISPCPTTPPTMISEDDLSINNNSSSKHKKSKKASKTSKEYDPDIHCGVIEGQKGPCTRSITCSNHKLQLRKSVPGRSKDIHLLINEKKAAKEKDSHRHSRSPTQSSSSQEQHKNCKSYNNVFPQILESSTVDYPKQNVIDDVPTFTSTALRVPPIMNATNNDLHDDSEIDDSSNQLESGYCSIETTVSSTKSSPIIYYNPISPIFVVTPVQFVQKENNMFVKTTPQPVICPTLKNGSYLISIPEPTSNIKFYKSHPKPALLPSFGARKVGGSILTSNQRLEYQRNDIEMAITTKRRATSTPSCKTTYNVPPSSRAILLKSKNLNKVNCKRTSTERPSGASDSKQNRLGTDVNGFILHTDMSEVADAPHYCIQENIINLLNMK